MSLESAAISGVDGGGGSLRCIRTIPGFSSDAAQAREGEEDGSLASIWGFTGNCTIFDTAKYYVFCFIIHLSIAISACSRVYLKQFFDPRKGFHNF